MKVVVLFFVLFASGNLCADDTSHTIRFMLGTANVQSDFESENDDINDQKGIFYNYQIDSNFGITGGFLEGRNDFCAFLCFGELFDYRELDYNSAQLSAKWLNQLTARWYVKGLLGVNRYSVEISGNDFWASEELPDIKHSGVKAFAAIGLEFRANNGFMFGFEIQHLPMDIIDVTSHNVTVGYSF